MKYKWLHIKCKKEDAAVELNTLSDCHSDYSKAMQHILIILLIFLIANL